MLRTILILTFVLVGNIELASAKDPIQLVVDPGVKSGVAARNRGLLARSLKSCDSNGIRKVTIGQRNSVLLVHVMTERDNDTNRLFPLLIVEAMRTISISNATLFRLVVFDDPEIDSFPSDVEEVHSQSVRAVFEAKLSLDTRAEAE